jgi:N6-adenosine-specific RNA methylase IME4
MTIEIHPAAAAFPDMSADEYAELRKSIERNGQRHPIILTADGQILDGRHRFRACEELGIDPNFEPFEGTDTIQFVIDCNLNRRHLDFGDRARLAAKLSNISHGGDRKSDQVANLPLDPISTEDAAKKFQVSPRSVRDAKVIEKKGIDELKEMFESKKLAVSKAAEVARLEPDVQRLVLGGGPKNAGERLAKHQSKSASNPNTSLSVVARKTVASNPGEYAVLYVDITIRPGTLGRIDERQNDKTSYLTWPADSLIKLPVGRMAYETAYIYMWADSKTLDAAMGVMKSWDFKYDNCIVWAKTHDDQTIHAGAEFEILLIGTRDAFLPSGLSETDCSILKAPDRPHGEKPQEVIQLIERLHCGVATAMLAKQGNAPDRWDKFEIRNNKLTKLPRSSTVSPR